MIDTKAAKNVTVTSSTMMTFLGHVPLYTNVHTFFCACIVWASQVALVVKNLPGNAGDTRDEGPIPGLGRSPGGGHGNPLQYSCLENSMGRGAWEATVHGVAKSWTRLSDFTFTFRFHASEKEMATHLSFLAWRIPGTREPGGLPSMGLHRVGHD